LRGSDICEDSPGLRLSGGAGRIYVTQITGCHIWLVLSDCLLEVVSAGSHLSTQWKIWRPSWGDGHDMLNPFRTMGGRLNLHDHLVMRGENHRISGSFQTNDRVAKHVACG